MIKKTMSLLTAITVLLAGGYYVAKDAPALAGDLTWQYPVVGGCYGPAEGFLVQVELNGYPAGLDTVFTNHYTYEFPAASTTRFRVVGFHYDSAGAMRTGMIAGPGCVTTADTAWSLWSLPTTTLPTIGVIPRPGVAVIIK